MSPLTRATLIWPATILAGLTLGGYVYAVWPDTTPRVVRLPYGESMPKSPEQVVRRTASVDSEGSDPESELAVYEVSATPLLDAVIQAPVTVDVH